MWVNGKTQVAAMARNQAIKDTGGLTPSNGSLLYFIPEQLLERGAVSVAGITNIVEGGRLVSGINLLFINFLFAPDTSPCLLQVFLPNSTSIVAADVYCR